MLVEQSQSTSPTSCNAQAALGLRLKRCLILQVVPRLSYVMLGLNLLVYGTGLGILFLEGFDNEQTYFFSLAKVNEAVAEGEYYRCAWTPQRRGLPQSSLVLSLVAAHLDWT